MSSRDERRGPRGGGLLGYFVRRRIRRRTKKDAQLAMLEIPKELGSLRQQNQKQSALEDELQKLQEKMDSLTESLRVSKVDETQLREDRESFSRDITVLKKQMASTQENLDRMCTSFQQAQAKADSLEEGKQEKDDKIKKLRKKKSHFEKSCAMKDQEIAHLKYLYEQDQDSFLRVRDLQYENTEKLKQKYHNALMYLWDMSLKCQCDCKNAWSNPGKAFHPINQPQTLQIDDSVLTGRYSLTAEPNSNTSILNSTSTTYESELYRYRVMNEMLEDKIKEYESSASSSSLCTGSHASAEQSTSMLSSIQELELTEDLSGLSLGVSASAELDLMLADIFNVIDNNDTSNNLTICQ